MQSTYLHLLLFRGSPQGEKQKERSQWPGAPQTQPFDAITSLVVKDVATGSGPHRKEHFFQFGSSRRH